MSCTQSVLEASRRYRANHPGRQREANKRWRNKNPEAHAAIQHRTYMNNREKRLQSQKDWYQKNKSAIQERVTEKRKRSPEYFMYHSAKTRAKKLGLEFTISIADIEIPTHCPALGIPLVAGSREAHESAPSIDRLDNNAGYVPGNIAVISFRANRIKSFGSVQELRGILKYMEENK